MLFYATHVYRMYAIILLHMGAKMNVGSKVLLYPLQIYTIWDGPC